MYFPEPGGSVPPARMTLYCCGASFFLHSFSEFVTLRILRNMWCLLWPVIYKHHGKHEDGYKQRDWIVWGKQPDNRVHKNCQCNRVNTDLVRLFIAYTMF